jgi:hypothetical protein
VGARVTRKAKVIVCSFTSTDQLRGRKRTYENLRAAVLEAGRFSVFEATGTMRDARMFTRLAKDPGIETFKMGFPWTGVRRRPGAR